MFDTQIIGRRIDELRKQNNMTQFELADKLSISFQAVSNWERGNSMPDISKLPQISELFNTSIDEIIGTPNRVLTDVARGAEVNIEVHTSADISDAAALIKPKKIEEIIAQSNFSAKISALLPYLDNKYIEELVDKYYYIGKDISMFLPFLSNEKIKMLLKQHIDKKESINIFLPFLSEEDIRLLIEKYIIDN